MQISKRDCLRVPAPLTPIPPSFDWVSGFSFPSLLIQFTSFPCNVLLAARLRATIPTFDFL